MLEVLAGLCGVVFGAALNTWRVQGEDRNLIALAIFSVVFGLVFALALLT